MEKFHLDVKVSIAYWKYNLISMKCAKKDKEIQDKYIYPYLVEQYEKEQESKSRLKKS